MQEIWLKNYPEGVPQSVSPTETGTLVSMFANAVNRFKGKTAFVSMGTSLSFEELDKLSDEFASFLQNTLKLEKGDRVAIQLPNVLQFPIALFGALKAGITVVNTNPLYTSKEIKHQLQDSGAKAVIVMSNFASQLEAALPHCPSVESVVVTNIGDMLGWPKSWLVNTIVKYVKKMVPKYKLKGAYSFYDALNEGQTHTFRPPAISPEDLAFLQYTGGTTGSAKGAMLTHKNITINVHQGYHWFAAPLKEGEEYIVTLLPLYHSFALTLTCVTLMQFGAKHLLITNPRDIAGLIKTFKEHKITFIPAVNTLFNALVSHPEFKKIDWSSLKIAIAGGMALHAPVCEKWKEVTGQAIIEGFGLTEASPFVSCNPVNGKDKLGTIGMPLPGTKIKLVDEAGQVVTTPDTPGELCVAGPQIMKGYWEQPEETANSIVDGWLLTGDIAVFDEDGYLKIVDRKKDMILVSGFNVFPNEIEEVASAHPKVAEAAAIGIPHKVSGEIVKLVVVASDPSLTPEELIKHCRESLTNYKVPKKIEFRDELPKTNVGKILRRALRDS